MICKKKGGEITSKQGSCRVEKICHLGVVVPSLNNLSRSNGDDIGIYRFNAHSRCRQMVLAQQKAWRFVAGDGRCVDVREKGLSAGGAKNNKIGLQFMLTQ